MDSIVGKLKPDPGVSHEQFKVSCMEYTSVFRMLESVRCPTVISGSDNFFLY
jgi:hypothetical protein